MCGIAGIYNYRGKEVQKTEIESLIRPLYHRGPDGCGTYTHNQAGLGHHRLSIIDLSACGTQPMSNEDKSVWIVCNGEIYNFQELRKMLEKKGHVFYSHSDSEILLHLYEEYRDKPESFLQKVRGMFAFALWDEKKKRMILGRDRLGIKPLFYYSDSTRFAFASEIGAFTTLPDVSLNVDWTSLYEYFQLLTIPAPNTIYKEIQHIEPGTVCILENDRIRHHRYWQLDPYPKQLESEQEVQEAVEHCLKETIEQHLIADVPVGTFLSAGIDSTVVTALASEAGNNRFFTFCATFPGEDVDEGAVAASTAKKLGVHFEAFSLQGGFLDELETIVGFMDQPLALTSALSLYQISRLAKEKVKVVLTGDGGDEIFGGYDHRHVPYFVPPQVRWIPEAWRPLIGKSLLSLVPKSLHKVYSLAESLSRDEAIHYAARLQYITPALAASLIHPDHTKEIDPERYLHRVRRLFKESKQADGLNRQLYVDIHTSLHDEMLTKADRMTMACGIEGRVPLLDHKLVELSMQIPGAFKRKNGAGKIPLRTIVQKKLGAELANRKKTGFNSPLSHWLKTDKRTKELFENFWNRTEQHPAMNRVAINQLKDNFYSKADAPSGPLFALIVLGLWLERNKV